MFFKVTIGVFNDCVFIDVILIGNKDNKKQNRNRHQLPIESHGPHNANNWTVLVVEVQRVAYEDYL